VVVIHIVKGLVATDRWGDYPTWAAAAGSILAVAGTIYAGVQAKKILNTEQSRDKFRDQLELRKQADLVSGWAIAEPIGSQNNTQGLEQVVAIVKNNSQQPIYRIELSWYQDEECLKTEDIVALIGPSASYRTYSLPDALFDKVFGVPNRFHRVEPFQIAQDNSEAVAGKIQIEYKFTDIGEIRWTRSRIGELIQELPPVERRTAGSRIHRLGARLAHKATQNKQK
jgi:hypothetical protein